MRAFYSRILYLLILSSFLFSCEKEEFPQPGVVEPLRSVYIEAPALSGDPDDLYIEHKVDVDGKEILNYCLEYSCRNRHAKWVAFSFYDLTAKTGIDRTDAWDDDPQVPYDRRSERDDYRGYDRGHICASYDRVYSLEANIQTFYYSNMSPQYGNFNRYIWQRLESLVQGWGRNSTIRDTLYVVKGGTITEDKIIRRTGPNEIPVPKYYFMALLRVKDGVYSSIAFLLEHRDDYKSPYKFSEYAMSVDELEEFTGFDFFCNLNDRLEEAVEREWKKLTWPGLE